MHRLVPDGATWSRCRNSRAFLEMKGSRLLLGLCACKLGSLHHRNVNYWLGRLHSDQQKCQCLLQERRLVLGKSASGAMRRGNPSTRQKPYRLTWMTKATANSSQMEMLPWNLQTSMILGEDAFLWVEHRWGQTKGYLNVRLETIIHS